MFLCATPYLSFKEVLGSFDSLNGDIYLRELRKSQQAAVLLELPSCSLMENQQELVIQRENTQALHGGSNKVQTAQMFTCRGLDFTFLSKGTQVYTNQAVPGTLYPALSD